MCVVCVCVWFVCVCVVLKQKHRRLLDRHQVDLGEATQDLREPPNPAAAAAVRPQNAAHVIAQHAH